MPLSKKILRVVLIVVAYLVAADVVGAIASAILDIVPVRGKTAFAFYVMWFVVGVFCGLLSFNSAAAGISPKDQGDWSTRADGGRTGLLVITVTAAVLALLFILANALQPRGVAPDDYFVPDSSPLTITFYVAVLGSMILANTMLRPGPSRTPKNG